MKCCSRSTRWRASALLILVLGATIGAAGQAPGGQPAVAGESAIRHAIVAAVQARMGTDADVRIAELFVRAGRGSGDGVLRATPEPGARLGRPIRFSLRAGDAARTEKPAGYAVATVFVAVPHVRVTRPVTRGETCEAGDLAVVHGEVGAVPLSRLPGLDETVGTRALKPLDTDDVLTRSAVAVRPLVRSGDVVSVRAGDGRVTIEVRAVAAQSGGQGDTIKVVNPESRRTLKARVVGLGKVEVIQ